MPSLASLKYMTLTEAIKEKGRIRTINVVGGKEKGSAKLSLVKLKGEHKYSRTRLTWSRRGQKKLAMLTVCPY